MCAGLSLIFSHLPVCLFMYTSLRLVLRSLGVVTEGFICRDRVVFQAVRDVRGADTIAETASLRNTACAQAYLHLLRLLPSRSQHISAAGKND